MIKKIFLLIFFIPSICFSQPTASVNPPLLLLDEGVSQGVISRIDCVGDGVSCSKSSAVGTFVVSGDSSGGGAGGIRHSWKANGPYIVDTSVDGGFISDTNFTITSVWLYRTTPGSSSSTIIDLNKNGTTMYTTQSNRPTIAFNDSDNKVDCTLPDVVAVSAGDVLTIDTDQIEGGTPTDYVLMIEGS